MGLAILHTACGDTLYEQPVVIESEIVTPVVESMREYLKYLYDMDDLITLMIHFGEFK